MQPTDSLDLTDLAEADTPEVVGPALRRFRRRFTLVCALVAVAAVTSGYVLASTPADDSPRARLGEPSDEQRYAVNTRMASGDLALLVLDAVRVSSDIYGVSFVASADALDTDHALHITVPVDILVPAPDHEPTNLPGFQLQTQGPDDEGFGAGRHIVQGWVLLAPGTANIPIDFLAAAPLEPFAAPTPPPAATADPDLDLPPAVPGTGQRLGTITIDLEALNVPSEIWNRE